MCEVILIQHGWIQDGCHHQVESEWMSEGFFVQMMETNPGKCERVLEEKLRWLNPRWPNSRWLPSSSWVRMNKFESDWISFSQESEWRESVFWVNLREDKKVSESKMAVSESNMVEFKMADIIKLSQNEWVKVFLCKWWEPILASVSEFGRKN